MDKSHSPPVCNNCAAEESAKNYSHTSKLEYTGFLLNNKFKPLIKAGLCVFFVVVLGFTILFHLRGLRFLTEINFNFLRYIPAFVALIAAIGGFVFLRSSKPSKQQEVKENITPAQIETLLKADNRLTVRRLARATNTSEEYAKKVLDDMVVDGKLQVSAKDSYELVYSGTLFP
jgi:predicted transcriptional regulator